MTVAIASQLLTPAETAEHLGIQEQTLAVWRTTGRHGLPFVRVGRSIRYRLADVEEWLAGRTVTSTGELDG
ncbi:MAG: helix-turn-helix domain-containing protein [Planctomycetota bacterium]